VDFPQLEGVDEAQLGPFPCHFCQRRDLATLAAMGQHEMVAHKDELVSLRTGESMGTSLAGVLNKREEDSELQRQVDELKLQIETLLEDRTRPDAPLYVADKDKKK